MMEALLVLVALGVAGALAFVGFRLMRQSGGDTPQVEDRPAIDLAARGAGVILNPSASHFAFAKQEIRREIALRASRDLGVCFVYSNLLGNESGRAIFDGDAMIASGGKMLAIGRRFSYRPVTLTSTVVNIDVTRMARARTGSFEPEIDGDESDVIEIAFEFPACGLEQYEIEPEG